MVLILLIGLNLIKVNSIPWDVASLLELVNEPNKTGKKMSEW